jgi:hypothetical protein
MLAKLIYKTNTSSFYNNKELVYYKKNCLIKIYIFVISTRGLLWGQGPSAPTGPSLQTKEHLLIYIIYIYIYIYIYINTLLNKKIKNKKEKKLGRKICLKLSVYEGVSWCTE